MIIRLLLIIAIILITNSCNATEYVEKCGAAKISFSEKYRVISDVQLNWGAVNSCVFENEKAKETKIKFSYQFISFYQNKTLTKDDERLISEFFANEKNIYNADLYERAIDNTSWWCFDELNDDAKLDVRCFYFQNKSKREIRIFGKNKKRTDVKNHIGFINLD